MVLDLLVRTKHGPPVYPPQPDGVWRSPYNDALDQQHRGRSIPTECVHLLEAHRAPTMTLFDAPSREVYLDASPPHAAAGVGGFERSDLQEAALGFGRRIQLSGDERAQLAEGFRLLTGRVPSMLEVQNT